MNNICIQNLNKHVYKIQEKSQESSFNLYGDNYRCLKEVS